MSKLVYSVFICILVMFSCLMPACGAADDHEKSYLSVRTEQNPNGGLNVRTLNCSYTVAYQTETQRTDKILSRAVQPVDVSLKIYWINDKGSRYNEETKVFNTKNRGGTFTTSFTAPQAGAVLDKTFWVKLEWKDDDGSHTVESSKAVCTVK
jgi:hypothetical protein